MGKGPAQAREHTGGNYIAGGSMSMSVHDGPTHRDLKRRKVTPHRAGNNDDEADELNAFVASSSSSSSSSEAGDNEQVVHAPQSTTQQGGAMDDIDDDDDDDDDLEAELEKVRTEKLQRRRVTDAVEPEDGTGRLEAPAAGAQQQQQRRTEHSWLDDAMFSGNARCSTAGRADGSNLTTATVINDAVQNEYHKKAMKKLFK
eukprot:PhM_4_TR1383/c1_g1_i1/m.12789/K12863/CWC15; protein CWC15